MAVLLIGPLWCRKPTLSEATRGLIVSLSAGGTYKIGITNQLADSIAPIRVTPSGVDWVL
jgi:hypothetical protein